MGPNDPIAPGFVPNSYQPSNIIYSCSPQIVDAEIFYHTLAQKSFKHLIFFDSTTYKYLSNW